jgi:hypothetical protein
MLNIEYARELSPVAKKKPPEDQNLGLDINCEHLCVVVKVWWK